MKAKAGCSGTLAWRRSRSVTLQFSHDCPHCGTRKAGFQFACFWFQREISHFGNSLAICAVCDLGLLLFTADTGSSRHADLVNTTGISFPGERFRILKTWPQAAIEAPDHVPPNVSAFYGQGLENYSASRFDAAGAMFRKSLDVATRILDEFSRSIRLFQRIEKLFDAGLITSSMRDWSHEIRLDGNDAVHDDEPETAEDALATLKFTEAFLTYTFSLPAMVQENRRKRVALSS